MTLEEYERGQYYTTEMSNWEIRWYTNILKERISLNNYSEDRGLSIEAHLCYVLILNKVSKEEILSMTFEEGLTYIYLFGDLNEKS